VDDFVFDLLFVPFFDFFGLAMAVFLSW